jgi:hypothetical protein
LTSTVANTAVAGDATGFRAAPDEYRIRHIGMLATPERIWGAN